MAESLFGFNNTSGSLTGSLTAGSFFIDSQGASLAYGTTSPSPQSGAGRIAMDAGEYVLTGIAPSTYLLDQDVYVDFFAWLTGTPSGQTMKLAGGTYYGASAPVAVNTSGQFGALASGGSFTAGSGSPSVPTGEWVRYALRNRNGSGNPNHGEVRMFKGANLLGTTPDSSVAGGTIGSEGYLYVGPINATAPSPVYIDELIISDTTWPTRSGGAPPPVPKGWWISKPG